MSKGFTEGNVAPLDTDFSDPQSTLGSINDLLRQQLSDLMSSDTSVDVQPIAVKPVIRESKVEAIPDDLTSCAVRAVDQILHSNEQNPQHLVKNLESLFDQLHQVYQESNIPPELRKRQFISRHGLVISPDHCVTTQKDTLRVRAFIRGVDQAIDDLRKRFDGCLHIVYPACGPFAPLLLPLISYYKTSGLYNENDLRITLIDMQPGAVASLNAVVQEMGVSGFITEIRCEDAYDYEPELPVHMVVLEAMQHGLSKEGHLPMARHFASLMEDEGIFLPQNIRLSAALSEGQKEFVEQWECSDSQVSEAGMDQKILNDRVILGDIFSLTPDSLRNLTEVQIDENTRLIACEDVVIPEQVSSLAKPLLLICTNISVYNNETLGEYDSGITHPLPDLQVCVNFVPHDEKPGDLLVKIGDRLKFYYRLNGLPGFLATLVE